MRALLIPAALLLSACTTTSETLEVYDRLDRAGLHATALNLLCNEVATVRKAFGGHCVTDAKPSPPNGKAASQ